MIMKSTFLLLATIVVAASASDLIFTKNSKNVVELTPDNWDEKVANSNDYWLVVFYAPWCGHSKNLVPEIEKVAKLYSGMVNFGAFDADKYQDFRKRYSLKGFPNVLLFGAEKGKPVTYPSSSSRTASELSRFVLKYITDRVNSAFPQEKPPPPKDEVVELTDSNFDKLVLNSDDIWLVEFFAPWCGHCKNLAPQWAEAARQLAGKVKLGALDATVHQVKASQFRIQGYPTIKYFAPGSKTSSDAEAYEGGRTASDIVAFALDKLAKNVKPPEIKQILSEKDLVEACEQPLCVISVLPHILDCNAACRNEYIKTLNDMGEKFKQKLWGWVWAEAGAQPDLETALEIGGFGYPAMAVLNAKKMKFSILRGSFSNDGINEFLRELSYGRGTTAGLRSGKLPSVQASQPWDGKDGELPADEDIDLSDVSLDDIKEEL
uniref:protein disulfide-isomerase n=1 Tax=Lygus hesperus TaxID=30085 RepID=A0A146M2T9_LYGHE